MSKGCQRKKALVPEENLLKTLDQCTQLKNDRAKPKFIKHEMLPPLTASYRQHRAIREVDKLHGTLKKEIEQCDAGDVTRQTTLTNVMNKCEALKQAFLSSENAVAQLQKQKDSHKQVMKSINEEIKSSAMEAVRYRRAAEDLEAIRDTMQLVIDENTCYIDFLENVALESNRYKSAREITGRFEKLLAVKKLLTERLDKTLEALKMRKNEVLQANYSGNSEERYVLQRLQAIDYELNLVKSKTIKYEMALNNISTESLEQMTNLNIVLKSAEQMIENLISSKIISKKYRKMTLAQQFEAVRKDYVKKKAVIREYQRGIELAKLKKTKRVKIFEGYENELLKNRVSQKRLDDLITKKKLIGWKKAQAEALKRLRRLKGTRMDEDVQEDYDVFKDKKVLLDLSSPPNLHVSRGGSDDDWEEEEGQDDYDDLVRFGSDQVELSSLVRQDGSEFVVMSDASSFTESASSTGSITTTSTGQADSASTVFRPRKLMGFESKTK